VHRIAPCEKRDQDQRARADHGPFHKPKLSAESLVDAKLAGFAHLVEVERALRNACLRQLGVRELRGRNKARVVVKNPATSPSLK
jgi:hypothetical protein